MSRHWACWRRTYLVAGTAGTLWLLSWMTQAWG